LRHFPFSLSCKKVIYPDSDLPESFVGFLIQFRAEPPSERESMRAEVTTADAPSTRSLRALSVVFSHVILFPTRRMIRASIRCLTFAIGQIPKPLTLTAAAL
jgi:hypothetical protein